MLWGNGACPEADLFRVPSLEGFILDNKKVGHGEPEIQRIQEEPFAPFFREPVIQGQVRAAQETTGHGP